MSSSKQNVTFSGGSGQDALSLTGRLHAYARKIVDERPSGTRSNVVSRSFQIPLAMPRSASQHQECSGYSGFGLDSVGDNSGGPDLSVRSVSKYETMSSISLLER